MEKPSTENLSKQKSVNPLIPARETENNEEKKTDIQPLIFSEKIGFKDYIIETPNNEELQVLKLGVDTVFEALKELKEKNDSSKLKNLFKNPKHLKHILFFMQNINFNDRQLRLYSIGIFVLDKIARFSFIDGFKKIIFGTRLKIKDLLKTTGKSATCIDMAVLYQLIAETYGIHGKVKALGKDKNEQRFNHRYFETDEGEVGDIGWGYSRGGFFKTRKQYEQMLIKMNIVDHFLGPSRKKQLSV